MNLICRFFFVSILSLLIVTGCQRTKHIPDVSHIPMDIHIIRFDREMSELEVDSISAKNKSWMKDYDFFYYDYMMQMLGVGDPDNEKSVEHALSEIIQQKDFKDLSIAVKEVFKDLKPWEEELNEAFRFVKYYFPEYTIPKFYSFFSGFAVQTPIGEDYIGIGLDMFLGADSEFYPAIIGSVPMYISRRFTPENITPRVIESVIRLELMPEEPIDGNTLEQMIYHGKVLYVMDCLLPLVEDSLKMGYTGKQMKWAQKYQSEIWAWFVSEELLYSTDYLRIQKYFSEAPFTPELGENNESAPKLGLYIGLQIVRKFMRENPSVGLKELLAMNDSQKILEQSGYRGK